MKKRDWNKFVIIVTLITILILLYIKIFVINDYVNGFKDEKEKNNKQSVEVLESFSLNENNIVYRDKIYEDNKSYDLTEEIAKDNLISKNEDKEIIDNVNKKNNIKGYEEKNMNTLVEEDRSIQVFKTDKNKLLNKISFKDKIAVLSIVKNLSSKEHKELLDNIKRNDELGAAVDIFTILKENLSEADYEELKEIAEPYLNIKLIEQNIK